MHHTVERILAKPTDYKVCKNCRALNWYENKICRACEEARFSVETKTYMKNLERDFYDDWQIAIEV